MTRREEREQAFILLFEQSFQPAAAPEDLYALALEEGVIKDRPFTRTLFFKTVEQQAMIDTEIEKYSRNWKISRMSKVALALLRMAVCEIRCFDEIPVKVSVNEAVELGKLYASAEDSSFMNGILGSVIRGEAQ